MISIGDFVNEGVEIILEKLRVLSLIMPTY